MTGENFIILNRHDTHLEKMLSNLSDLRDKWSEEYHRQDEDGYYIFDSNKLDEIDEKIKNLKYYIYTYVYNRNSIEYTREIARRYLW